MKALRLGIGVLALATFPVWAAAQEDKTSAEKPGEGAAMTMATPAPEMTKWSWMAGRWSVAETHEPSDWGPGGKGQGTMEVSLGPGGFSHVQAYRSNGPMGEYQGQGLTAWDPQKKVYRGVWADNMTPGISTSECREEGSDFVCVGESSMGEMKMSMRTRATNPNPEGWTEVFEFSVNGAPYQKTMTLEYEKAK